MWYMCEGLSWKISITGINPRTFLLKGTGNRRKYLMKKILLINDSKLQNQIMRDMLNSMNYEVRITDEYNALVAVHDFCPDFIIVNYVMKELTGDQLVSVIKIQYPNIKCIISSSNSLNINEFDNNKINAIITTPVDKDELKLVLESVGGESIKDDADSFEVKKYCSSCESFVDLNVDTGYLFCPKCARKI